MSRLKYIFPNIKQGLLFFFAEGRAKERFFGNEKVGCIISVCLVK